jgi:predicted acetyltransferase
MTMDGTEIALRVGTESDWTAISDLLGFTFHHSVDEENRAVEGSIFEPKRSLVAEDAGELVGHAAAYTRELSVPGAIVPAAYVTLVAVAPTHRRRGLLTRLMRRQLAEVAAAGREPLAVLWASEGRIYPRFGYGLAAQRLKLDLLTQEIRPPQTPPVPGARLRLVEPAEAIATFAEVYEPLRAERPGYGTRDERWWKFVVSDPAGLREGATALHGVVHETPEGPTGYALWRTRGSWTGTGPNSAVEVQEVVAADPGAYAALWRMLLTIDLTRHLRFDYAAVDEPLIHLVDEPRRLGGQLADSLWVRIVDVPGALAARRYASAIDLVLEVTDDLIPANNGRWRLTNAGCRATGDPADLACSVLELGSAYLGGPSLGALGSAGRVRELTPGALAVASAAFGWHRAPVGLEVF